MEIAYGTIGNQLKYSILLCDAKGKFVRHVEINQQNVVSFYFRKINKLLQ